MSLGLFLYIISDSFLFSWEGVLHFLFVLIQLKGDDCVDLVYLGSLL